MGYIDSPDLIEGRRYLLHFDVIAQFFRVIDAEEFEREETEEYRSDRFDKYFPENTSNTLIDITYRKVAGETRAFIVDDEGLLKADPILSAVTHDGQPALVGSYLIASADNDDKGLMHGLTVDEMSDLLKHLKLCKVEYDTGRSLAIRLEKA